MNATRLAERVLLIGWDGAEPETLKSLLESGRLPVLESLLKSGSCLELAPPRPAFSQAAWTSLATGKYAHEHGVLHEFCPTANGKRLQPIARHQRKTSALWNLLHRAGLQTHIVGWPITHPAESLAGIFVSDRFASPQSAAPFTQQDGPAVLPREAVSHLSDRRVSLSEAEEITLGQLLPGYVIGLRASTRLETACRELLAQSATLFRTIRWCLDALPWNFSACVFPGLRRSHELAHSLERLSPTTRELSEHLISGCYEHHDLLLGQILSQVGNSTHIIVISPTGAQTATSSQFEAQNNFTTTGSTTRNAGLAVFTGPQVRHFAKTSPRNLLDMVPTILTMFGLPCGKDLGGRPLLELFEPDLAPSSIESWETQPIITKPQQTKWKENRERNPGEEVRHHAVEHLVELGYVDPLNIAAEESVAHCHRATVLNRAISLLDAGLMEQAIAALKELKEEHDDSFRAHFLLAEALYRARQFEAARQEVDSLMCHGFENPQLYLLAAANEFADRRYDQALEELACTRRGNEVLPGSSLLEGYIQLRKRDFAAAEKAFRLSIQLEGPTAQALDGLATVKLHLGQHEEAALHALDAIDKDMRLSKAHYHLGVALHYLNKPHEALGALHSWASIDPQAVAPYRWMARVHELQLHDKLQAEACRQGGREAILRRRQAAFATAKEGASIPSPAP